MHLHKMNRIVGDGTLQSCVCPSESLSSLMYKLQCNLMKAIFPLLTVWDIVHYVQPQLSFPTYSLIVPSRGDLATLNKIQHAPCFQIAINLAASMFFKTIVFVLNPALTIKRIEKAYFKDTVD